MFRAPLLSLLFLFLAALPSCTADQVIEMETFERNLLLTWIALEREDSTRITEFTDKTVRNWDYLTLQYRDAALNTALKQSKSKVSLWMLNLRSAVANDQLKRAKMSIQLIQNELRVLRPKYGYDHSADRLYDFYYHWQDLVVASNDPMMCLLEWNEYEALYEAADKSWKEYLKSRPDFSDTLFPGYGGNAFDSEEASIAMSESLEEFALIFESANHSLAAEPSQVINDLFFDYLAVVTAYPQAPRPATLIQ